MRIARFLVALVLVSGVSSLALAQRGYHGGGAFGHPVVDAKERAKIQASDEQAAQLRTCLSVSERLRMLAADLKQPGRLSDSEWVKTHQRWNEVLIRAMESHHQLFLKTLNPDQQSALNDRLHKMDKIWSELASRFATMDRYLAEAAPDAKRVTGDAKSLQKGLKKWEKQHRKLGSEMGIES